MPLTRKTANTPVKATRSSGTHSVIVIQPDGDGKSKYEKKQDSGLETKTADTTKVKRQTEDSLQNQFGTIKIKGNEPTHDSKKTSLNNVDDRIPNETDTVLLSQNAKSQIHSDKKRKLSAIVAEGEPAKKTKLLVPDAVSPRRSSRAVVPNSRYKDMELLDTVKQKPSTSAHSVKKGVKKYGRDKVKDKDVTGVLTSSDAETDSSTVFEEIITYDTQIDDYEQMNLMDDILVLPQRAATISTTETDSIDMNGENLEPKPVQEVDDTAKIGELENMSSSQTVEILSIEENKTPAGNVPVVKTLNSNSNKKVIVQEVRTSSQMVKVLPSSNINVISSKSVTDNETAVVNKTGGVVSALKTHTKQDAGKKAVTPPIITISPRVITQGAKPKQGFTTKNESVQKSVILNTQKTQNKNPEQIWSIGSGKGKLQIISSKTMNQEDTRRRIMDAMNKMAGQTGSVVIHTPPPRVEEPPEKSKYREEISLKETTLSEKKIVETESINIEKLDVDMTEEKANNVEGKQSRKPHVNIIHVKVAHKDSRATVSSTISLESVKSETDTTISESAQNEKTKDYNLKTLPSETENVVTAGSVVHSLPATFPEINKETSTNIPDQSDKALEQQGVEETVDDISRLENSKGKVAETTEQNGTVCDVSKDDDDKDSSPQVAIEYVVFGDRIVPIHKPFSQSKAGVYKKKSTSLRRIPAKVAQTAISSLLEGIDKNNKPPNAAYTIDIDDQVEEDKDADGGKKCKQLQRSMQQVVLIENPEKAADNDSPKLLQETTPQNLQQKPGRVIHGYVQRQDLPTGETQLVEISQDLFAKEVYQEPTVLDPVTGEMVKQSMAVAESCVDVHTQRDDGVVVPSISTSTDGDRVMDTMKLGDNITDLNSEEKISNGEVIVAGSVDGVVMHEETDGLNNNPDGGSHILLTETVSSGNEKQHDDNMNTTFSIEKMSVGESVILQIDNNGMVIGETPAYRKVTDVKIHPAVSVLSTDSSGVNTEKQDSQDTEHCKSPACVQVKPVLASSFGDNHREIETHTEKTNHQREIETQTEYTMDESEEKDQVEESTDQLKTRNTGSAVVIVNQEDVVKRTTVMMEENGHLQEYVVVHLPEGAEIKQHQVKQNVKDPIHNEVVTMSEDGMYICVDCDHKTDRKGNWYKHRRKHLGIRPHACPKCSYKAATSSNLKRHMQIHDDVRNYECTICGLLFRQKIHLDRHIKYKHQEKKVKCPLCDYLCSSENPDLKIHIRRRHMPQEDGSMSAFTCNECGLMTVSKKDLKQHMKFHKKGPELKLFCESCSFVTDCESRLKRHMLIHTKEKPFQCGLCTYRASQKEHVFRHMKTQHDVEIERRPRRSLLGAKKSKPKLFSLFETPGQPAYRTTQDIQETATDKIFEKSDYSSTDKIFACNHCSMKFSKLINLYKHLFAQHKQVMPETATNFHCVVCDFRTNNKKNLLVHMRKHNMHDHSPPTHVYSCVLCRYINPRRKNLFQHMKKKHGIEIMLKDDGMNCYISGDVIVGQQDGEAGIMALSEIVTAHPLVDEQQLQIVTEDGSSFPTEKISLENIMSVEDINTYDSSSSQEQSVNSQMSPTPLYQTTLARHEAAEAIEGLQALAGQATGIVETTIVDPDISTEIITSDIMTEGEIMTTGEETLVEQGIEDDGIELSSEQLNQLSAGDYVEINGEVYQVEIAQENVPRVELP